MVSTLFAEANNLQIGSTFELENNVYNSELMISEGVEAVDLYNQIYVPHQLLEEIERSLFFYRQQVQLATAEMEGFLFDTGTTEENPLELFATFILHDSRDFNAFYEVASNILPEGWQVADTSGAFAPIRNSMNTML